MEKKIVDFWYMANRNLFLYWLYWCSLKLKCYYCDKIFITSCAGCCHCTMFHAVSGENFIKMTFPFSVGVISVQLSVNVRCFSPKYLLRHPIDILWGTNWVFLWFHTLTHWGRVTHICVSKLTIIGSNNGLSPGRRQAIIWTNDGKLLIEPLGTNFNEILIKIYTFSYRKMHLKMLSAKWRPFCLGLNVLIYVLPWHCYDLSTSWMT